MKDSIKRQNFNFVMLFLVVTCTAASFASAQIRPTAEKRFTVAAPSTYIEAYTDAVKSLGKGSKPSRLGYLTTCCSALLGEQITATSLRGVMRQCTPKFLAECAGLKDAEKKSSKTRHEENSVETSGFKRAPLAISYPTASDTFTPISTYPSGSSGGSGSSGATALPTATPFVYSTPVPTATIFVNISPTLPPFDNPEHLPYLD